MQTHVNPRIVLPNVLLMNNGPKEQNHPDNGMGGEEGWELQCVSKLSEGENPFLSLQNNKVFGSTVIWRTAFKSDNLLLFGSTFPVWPRRIPGQSTFLD